MAIVPIAVTSGDSVSAVISELYTLDGSGSYDPLGGTITSYIWVISDKPPGSTITLSSLNTVAPTFTPDIVGTYRFFLKVIASGGTQSETDETLAPSSSFSNISVPTTNKGWIIPATGQRDWGDYLYNILLEADSFGDVQVTSVNSGQGDVSIDLASVLTEGNSAPSQVIKIPQISGITAVTINADGEDLTLQGGTGNNAGDSGNLILKGGIPPDSGVSGNIIATDAVEFDIQVPITKTVALEVSDTLKLYSNVNTFSLDTSLWCSDGSNGFYTKHLYWTLDTTDINVIRPPSTFSKLECDSGVVVGDLVYVDVNGVCQKTLADNFDTIGIIGIVVEKGTTVECYVATSGEVFCTGTLIPNTRYFLSDTVPGGLTSVQPSDSGTFIAAIGIAIKTDTIILQIWPPIEN